MSRTAPSPPPPPPSRTVPPAVPPRCRPRLRAGCRGRPLPPPPPPLRGQPARPPARRRPTGGVVVIVAHSLADFAPARADLDSAGCRRVVFVATMGALHAGHRELI